MNTVKLLSNFEIRRRKLLKELKTFYSNSNMKM